MTNPQMVSHRQPILSPFQPDCANMLDNDNMRLNPWVDMCSPSCKLSSVSRDLHHCILDKVTMTLHEVIKENYSDNLATIKDSINKAAFISELPNFIKADVFLIIYYQYFVVRCVHEMRVYIYHIVHVRLDWNFKWLDSFSSITQKVLQVFAYNPLLSLLIPSTLYNPTKWKQDRYLFI